MSNPKEEHKILTQREQIILRPEMFVGGTNEKETLAPCIEDGKIVLKPLQYVPAVVKLIEELVANSVDEFRRTKENPKLRKWGVLDRIEISIDESGAFKVRDNGGITTDIHSTGYPTLQVILFMLNSSSNYDDTEERYTVGKNGYGAKLTNIFSKKFKATTADGKMLQTITSSDNMEVVNVEPLVKSSEAYTEVEGLIDLAKFKQEHISYSTMKYIESLCILSAAANPGLTIVFNGEEFKYNSFKEYVQSYGFKEIIGEKNEHWEHYTIPLTTPELMSQYGGMHFGLVNGVGCNEGSVKKMIQGWTYEKIKDYLKSKEFKKENDNEIIDVTPQAVYARCLIFTNILVDKPEYDSQAKDELTSDIRVRDAKGTLRWRKHNVDEDLANSSIVDSLKDWYTQRKNAEEAGAVRKRTKELKATSAKSIRKLIDATGTKKSERAQAELWIFEGQSAGSAFRPARSPKTQGALFLKGKCQNSYGMSTLKLINNEEFQNMIVSLGLDPSNPASLKNLRYGHIVVATDMDTDGDSIFGQIATMFVCHFPEIVKAGMLKRAISPLYSASKGKEKRYFYSQEEYDKFKGGNGWKTKYYKGLGSLTKEDYKEMLANPKFEEYHIDDQTSKYIADWMGGSSAAKKAYLEQR